MLKQLICSVCGKPAEFALRVFQDPKTKEWHCEHDKSDIGSNRLENTRKENREMTAQAMRMAQEAQSQESAANPDVPLSPIQGASQFGGDTVKIKKSVIDSLENKRPDNYG